MLADDHSIVRRGLASLLSTEPDIEVVGEAANGREAVELVDRLQPDVILMDLEMPEMDGIEAIPRSPARASVRIGTVPPIRTDGGPISNAESRTSNANPRPV